MLDIRNNRSPGILQHQETHLSKNIGGHTIITMRQDARLLKKGFLHQCQCSSYPADVG